MTNEEELKKIEIEREKFEEKADQEFKKILSKIEQDKTTDLIEETYFIPKQYVKMVAKGNSRGFLFYGECGLGKTYAVKSITRK